MKDLRLILTVTLLAGAVLAVVVYSISRLRARKKVKSPPPRAAVHVSAHQKSAPLELGGTAAIFDAESGSIWSHIVKGGLILLAIVVAAGFALVLLPQSAVDWMAQTVQSREAVEPPQAQLAFLYLGDEIKDGEFHVRGVVRNITTSPIEKLDATVRFYSPTGQLLETRSVRMDSELIPPDATAQFHLVYPGYAGQFGSYSVEFVLRQGEVVPYKDMRGARGRS